MSNSSQEKLLMLDLLKGKSAFFVVAIYVVFVYLFPKEIKINYNALLEEEKKSHFLKRIKRMFSKKHLE